MKKIVLILCALLMVASGVAAVSAYEAHMVNVTAHVELALDTPAPMAIGGVAAFPEEWITDVMTIEASQSFKGQSRVTEIEYMICAEPKTDNVPGMPPGHQYVWAGGFTFVSTDGGASWTWIGPTCDETPPAAGYICTGLTGVVTANNPGSLMIGMDMPVFSGYYNPETDVPNKPRDDNAQCGNKGVGEPCVVSDGVPTGEDFGLDIKIQVVDIR